MHEHAANNPVRDSDDDSVREIERDVIERVSVEGRPAHPGMRRSGVWLGLALAALSGAFSGVIGGVLFTPTLGVIIFVLITFIGAVLNPVLWAAVFRAREREAVHQRVIHERERHTPAPGDRA